MTVILSWIIAALGALCLYLLGVSSYQSYRRQLTQTALTECRENLDTSNSENRRLREALGLGADMRKGPQVSSPPSPRAEAPTHGGDET